MGKNVVVIGTQWGDEGKGKVVDLLTDRAQRVVSLAMDGETFGHHHRFGDLALNAWVEPSGDLLVMLILGGVGRLYGAFIGPVHRMAAELDGEAAIVAGAGALAASMTLSMSRVMAQAAAERAL